MKQNKPNVILIITDDQGYADLGCNGNPDIKTPNIDAFYLESARLTDFHVAPLCAPTRGGLMTGNRPLRNGVWATCWGRSILKRNQYTLAECFRDNGYETGMFGKWHLGDNYPYRPEDRGFKRVVAHKGGGVGQTPDFWGNNYFNDTYFNDSVPTSYTGYCTDVWFEQAQKYIMEVKDKPFFAYIATNAPHSPYLVEERYAAAYRGKKNICYPEFYGMITNIDENFGKLRELLRKENLEENTILIFMTDNGTSGGVITDEEEHVVKGYSANMRGKKGSYYEGGHRVPFFISYPAENIGGGKDFSQLYMYTDVMPTLIELCGLKVPEGLSMDGQSFASIFKASEEPETMRYEFLQYQQGTDVPEKWFNAVLYQRWRLIYGKELYDLSQDPQQTSDISFLYPQVVERMRYAHEKWWESVKHEADDYAPIIIGDKHENPTVLNAMDVLGDVAWSQDMVAKASKSCGVWDVEIVNTGKYKFSLRRWPEELQLPIDESYDKTGQLAPYRQDVEVKDVIFTQAEIILGSFKQKKAIRPGQEEVSFEIDINSLQETRLIAYFTEQRGDVYGAYYVKVQSVDNA